MEQDKLKTKKIHQRTNILGIIINILAFLIFIAAIYYLFTKGVLPFIGMTIYALALMTPRFIYKRIYNYNTQINKFDTALLSWTEILVTTAIILNSIGYLWLFDKIFLFIIGYDTFAHFITPILLTLALALILIFYNNLNNKQIHKSKFLLLLIFITIVYTFLWEVFEYVIDLFWHVGIFGEEDQPLDTVYDLVADVLSIPVTSVIIYKYYDYINNRVSKLKLITKRKKR